MKRQVEFNRSFHRLYSKLGFQEKTEVEEAIDRLLSCIESGAVSHSLGLKRLCADVWEMRVNASVRISFQMSANVIKFLVVGNHETIRKFLKNI